MESNFKETNLRYIVFLIDSKIKDHSGKIFISLHNAKEYAKDLISENYADKAIIGMFYLIADSSEMLITMIETIGFPGDKKNF